MPALNYTEFVAYMRTFYQTVIDAFYCIMAQLIGSFRTYTPERICGNCWKCAAMRSLIVFGVAWLYIHFLPFVVAFIIFVPLAILTALLRTSAETP